MILAVALALIILVLGGGTILMASGGTLGFNDLLTLAQNAGFQGQDAVTAAAIALAESNGNPGPPDGDQSLAPSNGPSKGLWQINIGTKANPQFANRNLYDPATNAAIAFVIYSGAGNSFRPWSTYDPRDGSTPKYLAYLPPDASAGVNA